MGKDNLPPDWTWERFTVVDAGNGQIALHCPIHNRFVRLNGDGNMDSSPPTPANALPPDWTWERWSVKITTPPPAVGPPVEAPPPAAPAPAGASLLPIGAEVALHSTIHNRFMRLHSNGNMDGSGHMAMNDLPADWTWERFWVVDGGNGQIALWSAIHNRFVRMHANGNMDGSGHMGKDNLPPDWTWERFTVVDAGNGQIALHCPIHNRFVRLNGDGNMDSSPP